MKQISPINIRELSTRQRIIDLALTDVEDFRSSAYQACRNFTKKQRRLLRKIAYQNTTSYDILATWQDTLKPRLKSLEKERTDGDFLNSIAKHLSLEETSAQITINQLVLDRQLAMLDDFTFQIYEKPKKGRDRHSKRRQLINAIMSDSQKQVEKLKNSYVEYLLFNEISASEKITILDPNLRLNKRSKLKRQIQRERKNAFRKRRQRLSEIYNRLDELSNLHDGLLTNIIDKKWDLMIILALRNNYDKKIAKLTDDQPDSATKRLNIFNAEVKAFKNAELEKMEMAPGQSSDDLIRIASDEIDNLLMQTFNLTNIQKNKLVLQMKEHRDLTAERKQIITELGKLS